MRFDAPAKKFYRDFLRQTFGQGRVRHWNKCEFEIGIFSPVEVALQNMVVNPPGQGHGRDALAWFLNLADKYKIIIYAQPEANGHCFLNDKQLFAWYSTHGFRILKHEQGRPILYRDTHESRNLLDGTGYICLVSPSDLPAPSQIGSFDNLT